MSPAEITKIFIRASAVVVNLFCFNGHSSVWRSQPMKNRSYIGNISLAASVLFSSNTYTKVSKFFNIANIPWISKTYYHNQQSTYMLGVANEAWTREHLSILDELSHKNCLISGDGRCDSPGHNAKYLTYSLFEQDLKKVVAMSLTQVTEAGNSNRMEKVGFIKVLDEMKENDIHIDRLTTDRHMQIRKYMREEENSISHQFDVWHFNKNIKTKLLNASKRKSCVELKKWIKSICNHLW